MRLDFYFNKKRVLIIKLNKCTCKFIMINSHKLKSYFYKRKKIEIKK